MIVISKQRVIALAKQMLDSVGGVLVVGKLPNGNFTIDGIEYTREELSEHLHEKQIGAVIVDEL
jgi:hypothetical protein